MADIPQPLMFTDLARYFSGVGPTRGKVRDLYQVNSSVLLFIATDRISAYDVILGNGVPGKGALLTQLCVHWFSVLQSLVPSVRTHFLSLDLPPELRNSPDAPRYRDRCMQVRRLVPLELESIVRGYITGSAWAEYKESQTVHGIAMPAGLKESQQLAKPIWTPSTKAKQGDHDENISPERAAVIVGAQRANRIEELSLEIYDKARDYAAKRGIIIADTKFEFAVDPSDDSIVLIDEILTPDSSRFWPAEHYQVGRPQKSLDKQFLRDWLVDSGQKGKEGVIMPDRIVAKTHEGYKKAFERLIGQPWSDILHC